MAKRIFTIEDLCNMERGFMHLNEETKCNEVIIFKDEKEKMIGVHPVKILERNYNMKDHFGSYNIKDILGEWFFDYYLKNKKSKKIKDKKIKSIDISDSFIRFNFKEGE